MKTRKDIIDVPTPDQNKHLSGSPGLGGLYSDWDNIIGSLSESNLNATEDIRENNKEAILTLFNNLQEPEKKEVKKLIIDTIKADLGTKGKLILKKDALEKSIKNLESIKNNDKSENQKRIEKNKERLAIIEAKIKILSGEKDEIEIPTKEERELILLPYRYYKMYDKNYFSSHKRLLKQRKIIVVGIEDWHDLYGLPRKGLKIKNEWEEISVERI